MKYANFYMNVLTDNMKRDLTYLLKHGDQAKKANNFENLD
jgi:hypothetical protein